MLGHTFCRYFWLSGTTLEVNSQGPSPHTLMPTIPCSFYLMDSSKGQVKKGCMWELESSEHCCPLEQEYQHGDQEREGTLSTSPGSIKGCCLLAAALSADADPRLVWALSVKNAFYSVKSDPAWVTVVLSHDLTVPDTWHASVHLAAFLSLSVTISAIILSHSLTCMYMLMYYAWHMIEVIRQLTGAGVSFHHVCPEGQTQGTPLIKCFSTEPALFVLSNKDSRFF